MAISSRFAHILHVCFFILFIFVFEILTGVIAISSTSTSVVLSIEPIEFYGLPLTILVYIIRLLPLLPLPITVCHTCGLIFYNVFSEQIVLKASPLLTPKLLIRVVTRGNYPQLVRQNVIRNLEICNRVGLDNFLIEIVTDKSINLVGIPTNRVREILVPKDYQTKTGALYKARALQYALEFDMNHLSNDYYIVHLDEETLLTENSVRGILNFVYSNEYDIGQGLITYANENIVNIYTTLADSARVGIDLGCLRFCLKTFNRPLFLFKGSYVVCRSTSELDITFDNGQAGSIAEDVYFAMLATSKNKRFGWIEGL
jgi:egghead protein (zeste-white 4 protein)